MRKVVVQCTFEVELDWEDDWVQEEDQIKFRLEENGCPGTGSVGLVFEEIIKRCTENNWCWACELKGENKIISIDGKKME